MLEGVLSLYRRHSEPHKATPHDHFRSETLHISVTVTKPAGVIGHRKIECSNGHSVLIMSVIGTVRYASATAGVRAGSVEGWRSTMTGHDELELSEVVDLLLESHTVIEV